MGGKLSSVDSGGESRDQALQDHGRLAGTGDTCHHGQPPLGNLHIQRMYRVDLTGPHADSSVSKELIMNFTTLIRKSQISIFHALIIRENPDSIFCALIIRGSRISIFCVLFNQDCIHSRQIGTNHGVRIFFNLLNGSLGDDHAAGSARAGAHFNHPVRVGEHLGVVVDDHDGIAVRRQVIHHACQSPEIIGVEADRRLIQDIEDAGRPVAHRPGQLYPLALARGQSGACPVQGQVAQAQIDQPDRGVQEGLADIFRHRPHGFRQGIRNSPDPGNQIRESHGSCLIQADSPQPRCPGRLGQTRPLTVGAGSLCQKALDSLHSLLILDL